MHYVCDEYLNEYSVKNEKTINKTLFSFLKFTLGKIIKKKLLDCY